MQVFQQSFKPKGGKMKTISILDTSICSSNLGDQIIMDAVDSNLQEMFENALFIQFPTHDRIWLSSYRLMRKSDLILIGGTNLLSSNMNSYNQWKVGLLDSLFVNNIVLMGVGWWQYQNKPNFYTKVLYKRLLSDKFLHSVRDNYTEQQLKSIGITNVINTSCPTMWGLTPEHCSRIPQHKSKSVLVTFTEYNQKPEVDEKVVNILKEKYEKIYFWTQQPLDYDYMRSLYGEGAIYIKPSLKCLDQLLSDENVDIDYVGTRLHAGIRALQNRRKTLILAVDNRANEISKDTNLPVVSRENIEEVTHWIESNNATHITLPSENINLWKEQIVKATLETKG